VAPESAHDPERRSSSSDDGLLLRSTSFRLTAVD
jgi:hypothetical protein